MRSAARQRSTWSFCMLLCCALAGAATLTAAAGPQRGDAVATPDFAFRLAYGICGGELIVDTFAGTLVRTALPRASLPLVLNGQDVARVQQAVEEMQFFALPARYAIVPPSGASLIDTVPSSQHRLRVRRDGTVHEVVWDTRRSSVPPDPVHVRLRDLAETIRRLVADTVVKGMPPAELRCA